ncbi:LacI family DNA-binding transcriptional regulator [Lentibacillus sediminis]|uniref:LacI family DNA-binding transcriptional regulator n=1 Tax=Lentibacillus sediminis TaxID=1940529 RepID=UPI000C1C1121|nr:LacI family DNA-binding transcriptional regulator [Lentibacillus sediminis]
MATIKDVAKHAGVAVSTVSYALNGNSKISKATRSKVIEAAKYLNYKKNGFASDLKKQSTYIIALILSDMSGPYYSEIIQGVQDTTNEHGYDLIACNSFVGSPNNKESTGIKFLKEQRVDGAIVMSHLIPDEVLIDAAQENFPIVVLNRNIESDHLINISVDNIQGGFNATKYLIEQGHRDIAFVGGPSDTRDNQDRITGFRKALEMHGVPYQPKWQFTGQFNRTSGYRLTKILLAQQDWPTAIFYGNDEMAVGGLKAFEEKNIRVPDEMSIIGFDGIDLAELIRPALTTTRQPKYEIGALCARFLFYSLHGESVAQHTNLQTELIIRQSTATFKHERSNSLTLSVSK